MNKVQELSSGYRIEIEYFINSTQSVDVAILKKQERVIAIEIEFPQSYEHVVDNLEKCLNSGFHKVICVLPNKKQLISAQDAARERLTEDQLQRTVFSTLPEFLSKNGKYENPKRFLP